MYTEFYRLRSLPFQLGPDPRFFFGSAGHQKAMAYLTYGLTQGEGFIVITGEVGAGKTTLVGRLFETLNPKQLVSGKIVTTQMNADDTVRLVAGAFGIPSEGVDKASLLQRIEAFLRNVHASGRRALLVVDEVQNLSVSSLEELRMLSNFQIGQTTLLQSFLIGQPQFRPILSSPDLEQLRQRVIASYHLGPLTQDETKSYIEHRLTMAGWQQDPVFAPGTMESIYQRTDGVPRKINTLCSRLLLFGCLENRHTIEPIMVDQVAEELAQELYLTPESANAPLPKLDLAPRPYQPPAQSPALTPAAANGADTQHIDELNRRVEALEAQFGDHDRKLQQTVNIMSKLIERL
jgi:putative secretion ATPase (PEP-CTERM system associated)